MKLNNKGFAVASILYSIMVLFLMLLLSILGILGSRKAILDKNKKDILDKLNGAVTNSRFKFEHRDITIINNGNIDDIIYALMDGVSAIDKEGNNINVGNISYNLDVNNIENKDYTVTYTAKGADETIIGTRLITFIDEEKITTFSEPGEGHDFTPEYNGAYKIELWGAQGGNNGGHGAYTSGNIELDSNDTLYVYVGGAGETINWQEGDMSSVAGGFNGGGNAVDQNTFPNRYWGSGGGATDIRLESGSWDAFESLKTRIMVAAGGGGSHNYDDGSKPCQGGAGGTLVGLDGERIPGNTWGTEGLGGTQTSGGYSSCLPNTSCPVGNYAYGGFGLGGQMPITSSGHSGGGSGYYGGGGSRHVQSAGGGSSFISGYDGCDAIDEKSTKDKIIHTGQSIHYSGYVFDNSIMYAGNSEMPDHDGNGTMVGNSGNGYAKISLIYYY